MLILIQLNSISFFVHAYASLLAVASLKFYSRCSHFKLPLYLQHSQDVMQSSMQTRKKNVFNVHSFHSLQFNLDVLPLTQM